MFERISGVILCWLATWMLVFPAYAVDLCFKRSGINWEADCKACGRALPLSLMPSLCVIATSWAFQRSPMLTIVVSVVMVAICFLVALNLHSTDRSNQLVGLPALLQRSISDRVHWPGGRRPTVGSRVRVLSEAWTGLEGEITLDDRSDLPYKVEATDGSKTDWFTERQVEWFNEQESPALEEAPQQAQEASQQAQMVAPPEVFPQVQQLQQPLLPPDTADGGTPSL